MGDLRQPHDRGRGRGAGPLGSQGSRQGKVIAAHLLEAAVEDMEYEDGKFFVKGSPDRNKTIQDVSLMAHVAWDMPEGVEAGLEAATFYDPPNFVFSVWRPRGHG